VVNFIGQNPLKDAHIDFLGEFGIGLYNNGMETLPGPEIKVKACHSPNNNFKHKRTADNHVNPDIDST
jgi:hypothetical protein